MFIIHGGTKLATVRQEVRRILQDSVVTHLRCGCGKLMAILIYC